MIFISLYEFEKINCDILFQMNKNKMNNFLNGKSGKHYLSLCSRSNRKIIIIVILNYDFTSCNKYHPQFIDMVKSNKVQNDKPSLLFRKDILIIQWNDINF